MAGNCGILSANSATYRKSTGLKLLKRIQTKVAKRANPTDMRDAKTKNLGPKVTKS